MRLGAAQATHVGMAALQLKAVKLEGPPPPTGGARSTHKRELVHPTSTASWGGRGCFSGTLTEDSIGTAQPLHETVKHSPTEHSSMEGPTLNFLLSCAVSCASTPSTTCWCPLHGGFSRNSVMFVFLAIPLTAATPNLYKSVCGTCEYCRSEQFKTVQNTTTYVNVAMCSQSTNVWKRKVCQMLLHRQDEWAMLFQQLSWTGT